MRPSLPFCFLLAGLVAVPAAAASFDCAKARSKLNRMICADADLSALDSRVWDYYGERIKTLSPAQIAHVRDRHLTWRRQRGWFDDTAAEIAADYRRHLAWLSHPLLPLEGRYENGDGHTIQVELDLNARDRLSVLGEVRAFETYSWAVPAPGEAENRVVRSPEAAASRPSLVALGNTLHISPVFLGNPSGPVRECRVELKFGDDSIELAQTGQCGSGMHGVYRRLLRPQGLSF